MSVSPLLRLNETVSPRRFALNETFSVGWQSPSNIALVKYWGKKEGQLPATPSLSMTLDRAVTRTRVIVSFEASPKGLVSVNGDLFHPFLPKMRHLLHWMTHEIPVLAGVTLTATTENSFPHSTGIASSASGISAFALCLLTIACDILKAEMKQEDFMHIASYAARMGSGSACRSLYGGFSEWGKAQDIPGSSDEFAIPAASYVHPEMMLMKDAILVVSGDPKSLPSSMGHQSIDGHPFFNGRMKQAETNLHAALGALFANDFEKLGSIAECEALTLHALIMSANPGTLLMKPGTVGIIHRVREARKTGLPLFFTLDAGANVHVMYPAGEAVSVEAFIRSALQPLCENERVIFDCCGPGPARFNDTRPDL
ncbi:MAG: diphosphomevalonate decarboxylase [Bacteroidetes bacterium]|nr:diphosphomevalonate decarboxylase [Bacteroidota bacterium]